MIIKRLLVLTSVVSPTQKNAGDTDLPFLTNGMLTKTNISKESKTINWGNKQWTCNTDSNIYQVSNIYPTQILDWFWCYDSPNLSKLKSTARLLERMVKGIIW